MKTWKKWLLMAAGMAFKRHGIVLKERAERLGAQGKSFDMLGDQMLHLFYVEGHRQGDAEPEARTH